MSASFRNAPPNKVSETRYKVKELDTVLVIDEKKLCLIQTKAILSEDKQSHLLLQDIYR
jgi:hypothetical protein